MEHSKFKFNPENLDYRKLDDSLGARIWRFVIYMAAIVVIAVLLNVVYSLFFDTPRERQIRRENEMLLEQYEALSERKQMVDTVIQEVEQIDKDIYRVIFETEPVQTAGNQLTGLDYQKLLKTPDKEIVHHSARKLDSLMLHLKQSKTQYDILMIRGEKQLEMLPFIPAIQPIENQDLTLIASGFGNRIHPIYKIFKMHNGIDFSAPVGTPVFAAADGQVESAVRSERGLGNQIRIEHDFGYSTFYACLDELMVRQGARVKRGDQIGTVGDSGLSVAPHLHYEVHLNGEPMNPINYFFLDLTPEKYDRAIVISMMSGQSFD
ncbi:MAG: M23 family metallopeptidase [Bacteroidales bacterium]|nr:M23 family metallopeptidase [Bacteroidales bacterium]